MQEYCSSQDLQYTDIIKRFREAGTVENHQRPGRPRAMDDTGYRQLEKIVKNERRAPLAKITANFNEERNVSVSKRTVRRRLRDHGFSRSVCRKEVVVKLAWCMEKTWWTIQYQWSKVIPSDESQVCIGQVKRVFAWGNEEKGGDRNWCWGERTASSVLWCGMHLLERHMNTYEGAREYKC